MGFKVSSDEEGYFLFKDIKDQSLGKEPSVKSSFNLNLTDIANHQFIGRFTFDYMFPSQDGVLPLDSIVKRFTYLSSDIYEELVYLPQQLIFVGGKYNHFSDEIFSLQFKRDPNLTYIKPLEKIFQPLIDEMVYRGDSGIGEPHLEKVMYFKKIDRSYGLADEKQLKSIYLHKPL